MNNLMNYNKIKKDLKMKAKLKPMIQSKNSLKMSIKFLRLKWIGIYYIFIVFYNIKITNNYRHVYNEHSKLDIFKKDNQTLKEF
jgi:hypothetical protein